MTRMIAVKDRFDNDGYVVAESDSVNHSPISGPSSEVSGSFSFYLSSGEELNHQSAERFEDPLSGISYYAQDEKDIEWLLNLG